MKKWMIKNIMWIALVTISIRCDDFLEKPLQGQLTQENFPVTAEDALLATNAAYHIMRNGDFHSGLFPILDIMSDDARKGSNPDDAASTIGSYDNFTHVPTETSLDRWWNTLYEAVRRANVVIEKVPIIEMDATLRNRYVGEAKFLRALFYFDIVRAWGQVPLVSSTTAPANLERSSVEAVYDRIEGDLLDAINALPERSEYGAGDQGRATRGAAKALLAKVYLFQGDFINAEKYALEVINSNEYDLEENFEDANGEAGEYGIESVFEVGAIGQDAMDRGGSQYGNIQGVRGTPNRGWGFNRPSMDLMHSFETNDPRLEATVIHLGEVLDSVAIAGDVPTPDETRDGDGNLIEVEAYNQKVWTTGTDVASQWGHNRRILRYADVLLMAAEALNENGNPEEALAYLNDVRERAREGNPSILPDATETDQDLLRDIIIEERRHELALEGHRFWDLIRTGKATAVLGPLGFVPGKHELLPIPQSEMDLIQNEWQPNPGWE